MSGQVQDVLNRFEEAMEKIDGMGRRSKQSSITSLMNCSRVFHHHHRLPLTHLYNNNNNVAFQIKWDEHNAFPLTLGKILVPLLMLLSLLLLLQRWRTIRRMRLIKIRTTCNNQHHHHQVVLMHIIATVGLHHHLRYMTIFLN